MKPATKYKKNKTKKVAKTNKNNRLNGKRQFFTPNRF